MKQTPIRRIGKVGKARAKNMAKWKREHPVPAVCPLCGRAPDWRGMHPHHTEFRSQGGQEGDNLQWLCARCHIDDIHRKGGV